MTQKNQNGNIVAIITMIFLFAMISFVTNLAVPIGVIWGNKLEGLEMMGNLMNFAAYLFMGIPAGKLLSKIGYKKTALAAIAVGFLGIFIQYLSGIITADSVVFTLPINFIVYLLGAFVAGMCVCMLNSVVNPMLDFLGGGGNRGNRLLQIGGSFNSLAATITPMIVGILIGTVTKDTAISDVNLVLYIAMGVFAATFIILAMIPIEDPENAKKSVGAKMAHSPWYFRHFVLGAIAIFIYVGLEVGIPGVLLLFLSDVTAKGGGLDPATATATAGIVAGTYWLLMFFGRMIGGAIGDKVSSKTMLMAASTIGIIFVLAAMFAPVTATISMPAFDKEAFAFEIVKAPISALFLVLCGFCTSIMWGGIFNLATQGLGKYINAASGIFMTMVVGGGVLPLIQNWVAGMSSYMISYLIPLAGLAYLLYYALIGSKNVNKDIPVD